MRTLKIAFAADTVPIGTADIAAARGLGISRSPSWKLPESSIGERNVNDVYSKRQSGKTGI
jgi:hypothetical protein